MADPFQSATDYLSGHPHPGQRGYREEMAEIDLNNLSPEDQEDLKDFEQSYGSRAPDVEWQKKAHIQSKRAGRKLGEMLLGMSDEELMGGM